MEPEQRLMSPGTQFVVGLCSFVLLFFAACGFGAVLQAFGLILIGWPVYLVRVVPQLSPDPWAVISGVLCLAVVIVGMHVFARWLYAAADAIPEGTERRRWPWKWTGQLAGLVVLMFVGGVAFTGLVQQTIWVLRSPEPLTPYRGPSPKFSVIGNGLQ